MRGEIKMFDSMVKRAAKAKAALMSKEAANNSTEIVIIILGTVIIASIVAVAIKTIIGDESSGVLGSVSSKFGDVQTELEG